MRRTLRNIIAVSSPKGDVETIKKIIDKASNNETDALAVIGDLTQPDADSRQVKEIFSALGKSNIPSYYIPGPNDSPIATYLRETHNIELVYPTMHGVHGVFAFAPGYILIAGMGGNIISESSEESREELKSLQYYEWEVEYRLKILHEIKDYPKIFLFNTLPAISGIEGADNKELSTLIKTHNPQLVISGGTEYFTRWIGKSLLVNPGALADKVGAFIDLRERKSQKIII